MKEDYLYSLREAEKLVEGFTQCTLSKNDWTHESHLIAGLYMLAHYGDRALDEMRPRVMRFNHSVGGVNDDQNGYHETLTVFWLWAIREMFADDNGKVVWDQEALDDLLFDENLADRNIWQEFYSQETMMSVAARRGFVQPDRKPMSEPD